MENTVLSVKDLRKHFPLHKTAFSFKKQLYVQAVNGISFDLHEREVLGIVGESGSGKTTAGRLIVRLETPTAGNISFEGQDIATLSGKNLKKFRKNVQMIFQDPYESLNPRFTVFKTLVEPLVIHEVGETYEERTDIVIKALEDSGLKPGEEYLMRFPHELSGGQRQRVAVARTLVINPKFIVADEPVSMLDVSIRSGIMNLMLDLRDKYRLPIVFITHDIAVSRYMSDTIIVLYLGKIVEKAQSEDIIFEPIHPYTRALLSAVPIPDPEHKHGEVLIKGEIPSPINLPQGCLFYSRCLYAEKGLCDLKEPPLREIKKDHYAACHFAEKIMGEEIEVHIEEPVATPEKT